MNPMHRQTVDLGTEQADELKRLAEAEGGSKVAVMRRALVAYALIRHEERSGRHVAIIKGDGTVVKQLVLSVA